MNGQLHVPATLTLRDLWYQLDTRLGSQAPEPSWKWWQWEKPVSAMNQSQINSVQMSGLRLHKVGLDLEHTAVQKRLRTYNTFVLRKLVHIRVLMVDVSHCWQVQVTFDMNWQVMSCVTQLNLEYVKWFCMRCNSSIFLLTCNTAKAL
jgi:hypothetical protein